MHVSGGTGSLITIYRRVRVSGILLNMYMRNTNIIADKITKNVLTYLLNNFHLAPGDINNIRLIVSKTLANSKFQIPKKNLKENKKAP